MQLKTCITFLKRKGFSFSSVVLNGIISGKRYIYTKHYNLDLLLPSFFLTPTEVGKGEYEQMESGHF